MRHIYQMLILVIRVVGMPNQFIEVARFFDPTNAHILRGLLESEDIQVEIFDEYFSSLTPVDSVIAGGNKITNIRFRYR